MLSKNCWTEGRGRSRLRRSHGQGESQCADRVGTDFGSASGFLAWRTGLNSPHHSSGRPADSMAAFDSANTKATALLTKRNVVSRCMTSLPADPCVGHVCDAPVNVSKPKTGGLLAVQYLVRQLALHVIVPPVCTPNSIHVLADTWIRQTGFGCRTLAFWRAVTQRIARICEV